MHVANPDIGNLFDAPTARLSDPETSHEAAATVGAAGGLRARQAAILTVLDLRPMDHETLIDEYRLLAHTLGLPAQTPQSIRSRCAELVRAGRVVHNGEYARTRSGRRSRIWMRVVD